MKNDKYISITTITTHYQIEKSFIAQLIDIGLIKVVKVKRSIFIHKDHIVHLEKMLRMHHELAVNPEGIDVIFNLLQKLDNKESELQSLRNRLKIYEI